MLILNIGKDGPSHQPVEVLSLLRSTPQLKVFRPFNTCELIASYKVILFGQGPSVISLPKDNFICRREFYSSLLLAENGAYVLYESPLFSRGYVIKSGSVKWRCRYERARVILISTGSEVGLALQSAWILETWYGLKMRVVSCPCLELFRGKKLSYRRTVIPDGCLVISIEAASKGGWPELAHFSICIEEFGISGEQNKVMKWFGFGLFDIVSKCLSFENKFFKVSKSGEYVFNRVSKINFNYFLFLNNI